MFGKIFLCRLFNDSYNPDKYKNNQMERGSIPEIIKEI
jgi:hypothetical protein